MPRFYFNVSTGDETVLDEGGVELPNTRAVLRKAVQNARNLVADQIKAGEVLRRSQFEVADSFGVTVLVLPILNVIKMPN